MHVEGLGELMCIREFKNPVSNSDENSSGFALKVGLIDLHILSAPVSIQHRNRPAKQV